MTLKSMLMTVCIAILVWVGLATQPVQAQGGEIYTVQPGDTLTSIAFGYGITVDELLAANYLTWNTWVYAGQQLVIPTRNVAPLIPNYPLIPAYSQANQASQTITVQPGDSLLNLAANFGLSADQLAAANGLPWNAWLYVGQQLIVPTTQNAIIYDQPAPPVSVTQPAPHMTPAQTSVTGERWIDVNLTTQTVTAYEGDIPVYNALASTGRWQYPTVVGTYQIYVKYDKARMRGGVGADAYDLPDVPYVMYFYRGYGLHGTYWHNNFGTPMSHGCVNLSIPDSEWFFNWASIGTKVVTHY